MSGLLPPAPEIPIVVLESTQLSMTTMANGVRLLTIGPLMLGLPLSAEAERWLADNVNANASGLIIARPMP